MLRIIFFIIFSVNLLAQVSYRINPQFEDTTIFIGDTLIIYVHAYDEGGNSLGDVSGAGLLETTDSLDPMTGYMFIPTTHYTSGRIIIPDHDSTGVITVLQIDHIRINNSPGADGVEVGAYSMTSDDMLTLYCASYDLSNEFIGNVEAEWISTGTLDSVDGIGISYTFNPYTAPTWGTIIAIVDSLSDATGTITVNIGDLDYVKISPQIGDTTIFIGDSISFYPIGYDQDGNFRGHESISVTWSTTGTLDPMTHIGSHFTFTPVTPNTAGRITIGTDSTGVITVLPKPAKIAIQYPDGTPAHNDTIINSNVLTLCAAGNDSAGYFIDYVPAQWSLYLDDFNLVVRPAGHMTYWELSDFESLHGIFVIRYNDLVDTSGFIVVHKYDPVSIKQNKIPSQYTLSHPYPNPANPTSRIDFSLPKATQVNLEVFNILGEHITTLINERKAAGSHSIRFDASDLPSGIYLYRIQCEGNTEVRKMVVLK